MLSIAPCEPSAVVYSQYVCIEYSIASLCVCLVHLVEHDCGHGNHTVYDTVLTN